MGNTNEQKQYDSKKELIKMEPKKLKKGQQMLNEKE